MATQTRDPMTSYGLALLRIVAGFLFSCHGLQKIFGMFGGMGGHRVPLASLFGVAGTLETFGGILIILGLFTRPVAFVLCGEMAYAYFAMHFPRGFLPLRNGGELAVLNCFSFLLFVFAGPGAFSLDGLVRKRQ